MIDYALSWIAAIIFVEATVEIEVNSEIFAGFRSRVVYIKWIGWYLNGLFSCGYCLSVWVSAIAALFVPGHIITSNNFLGEITQCPVVFFVADFVFKTFVIHRLANAWHELIYRWLERMPWILALNRVEHTNTLDTELLAGEQDESTTENSDEQDNT